MSSILLTAILLTVIFSPANFLSAQESYMKGKKFAACDFLADKVRMVDENGKIGRTDQAHWPNDIWALPDGHLLYTTGKGIRQVDSNGKTVLEFNTNSEVHAVQRLKNGNTFLCLCSTGQLTEINAQAKIVKQIDLLPNKNGGHMFSRIARVLDNGHYLISNYGGKKVIEYDQNGKEVWAYSAPFGIHGVTRLKNGNTVITSGDLGASCLWEIAPDKSLVWKVDNDDLPGRPLRYVGGFQVMPNGNYVICNWLGHNHFKEAPHLLEINRDKKIVWSFSDFENFKTISAFSLLETN